MRVSTRIGAGLAAVLLVLGLVASPTTAGAVSTADSPVTVAIGAIDLENGPSVEKVDVTVANASVRAMRDVTVSLTGPRGWNLAPSTVTLKGRISPGASGVATFSVLVPERQDAFTIRSFTATVRYTGGDGAGTVWTTSTQAVGEPAGSLAELYDTVGSTTVATRAAGDLDGDGNSLSREQLALAGLAPGAGFTALGVDLTWPDVAAGEPDHVAARGQAVAVSGRGDRLVLVGTGIGFGATGTATVIYTDGTSTSGSVGFPNWCCQAQDAHGATLVAATDGRNTQAGYANAEYEYSVFAHSVALDPAKEVELVVLPATTGVRVFTLGIG